MLSSDDYLIYTLQPSPVLTIPKENPQSLSSQSIFQPPRQCSPSLLFTYLIPGLSAQKAIISPLNCFGASLEM